MLTLFNQKTRIVLAVLTAILLACSLATASFYLFFSQDTQNVPIVPGQITVLPTSNQLPWEYFTISLMVLILVGTTIIAVSARRMKRKV
jgi:ABC-type antimicrobial peptide transport system permease subunit